MFLSMARVAPLYGRVDVDPEWVRSRLWEHRPATGPVEHIRVGRGWECLRVAAFTVAPDQHASDDVIRHLINATIRGTPRMSHWRLL